ncbi:Gas vesicle synthesis protein GvpL/GvpF [Streptomyces sp. ADI98-12]|uniref:GvpL/GvpF family gas vesicle protein n=1 Tax=Streptomyces TaxID=1883 RepID=UPI000F54D3FD|nr:GvpL/GvpF family gas vesicle protein [Streptomyces sp. ADI98-12]RPK89371.1 Gas vesicle synthesis protein GvpL/GvpF [Streptomyces sp. ADI98-12]
MTYGTTPENGTPRPADAPVGDALYVYALLPEDAVLPPGTTGLDDRPLQLVTAPGSGLAALVHRTTPAPYQGPDEQVRQWVREQDAALVAVWEQVGTALPMTFNVLVAADREASAEERVRQWLTDRADVLRDLLGALAGRAEVRVEISLDREAVTEDDEEAKALLVEMEGRSPGLRRMLAKRLERLRKEAGDRLADALHSGVRRRLAAVAEDLSVRAGRGQEAGEVSVFAGALLVRREEIDTVGALLAELQEEQPAARIRFLGPWPPYAFTELPAAPGEETAPEVP